MLKRFVIALSVTASALLLPATAAQAADGVAAVTATTATTGESGAATTTGRPIGTPSGAVVTVGTTTGGIRLSDPSDSSWGG